MREGTHTTSLAAEVYGVVRRRILRGDLPVGEVISRREIAADLSTSLPPVTEALLRLEYEGLLEHRPRAGTRVRIPSPDDVRGHYIVLEALEAQAAALFAEAATRGERAELLQMAARVDALASEPDRQAYASVHQRLHLWIAECSRCPALHEAIERTYALPSIWLPEIHRPSGSAPPGWHRELAARVAGGDPAAAARAARAHGAMALRWALEVLEPFLLSRRAVARSFSRTRRRGAESHPVST
ncbi:MAG: GntR family transcriptional regulator [Acidobacteria bacterium]|nr:GntR family transcriptional regulator [Acidobacteriota bacterium]